MWRIAASVAYLESRLMWRVSALRLTCFISIFIVYFGRAGYENMDSAVSASLNGEWSEALRHLIGPETAQLLWWGAFPQFTTLQIRHSCRFIRMRFTRPRQRTILHTVVKLRIFLW